MFAKQNRDQAQSERTAREAYASADPDTTGSVEPTERRTEPNPTAGAPPQTDLVFAGMAIVDVLKRGSHQASAPWENPSSGAHGTVTPIASVYARGGETCRDFLASHVGRQGAETWMQGEACRSRRGGVWEVKTLKPWSRT